MGAILTEGGGRYFWVIAQDGSSEVRFLSATTTGVLPSLSRGGLGWGWGPAQPWFSPTCSMHADVEHAPLDH